MPKLPNDKASGGCKPTDSSFNPLDPSSTAPVEAFRFTSDFAPGPAATDGTVPFTTLARTANPVAHWYWGDCVHDFAGMSMANVIPVDYAHSDCEALGLINGKSITAEGL